MGPRGVQRRLWGVERQGTAGVGVESGLPGHPRGWVLSGALLVPGLQGVEEVEGWQEQAWSQGHGGEQAGPLERTGPEGRQGEEDREARLWGGLEGETFSREQGPPPCTPPPLITFCALCQPAAVRLRLG